MDCILCRYGELALKGKNRSLFENRLVENISLALKSNDILARIEKVRGRIFVFTDDRKAPDALQRIFGLVSISPCITSKTDKIQDAVLKYAQGISADYIKTFRISAKRIDKRFPKTSNEMNIELGDAVSAEFGWAVKLKDPDLDIGVEIHDRVFIFHESLTCPGGLPYGITGKVTCLIRKRSDVAAAWLMMRRGCSIELLTTNSPPLNSDGLEPLKANLCLFAEGQSIRSGSIQSIDDVGGKMENSKALIIGDTFNDFNPEQYRGIHITILNPLIAYTEDRIDSILKDLK